MGATTGISWAHHTFAPWWGCVEVSPACDRCYAKAFAERFGFMVWGAQAPRRFFGLEHWAEPLEWDRKARRMGQRRRVFCSSMADIGETRDDDTGIVMEGERARLWELIRATEWLDWMLLTKRPSSYLKIPADIRALPRVWLGVTVESAAQEFRINKAQGGTWRRAVVDQRRAAHRRHPYVCA